MNRPERAEPSERLLAARRGLEGHPHARVVGELLWHEKNSLWAFAIDLTVDSANSSLIPNTTRWFVLVDPRYPWGSIEIYPGKANGIDKTFPHQDYNGAGDDKVPWRDGDICVRAPGFALGRSGEDPDPKGDDQRLLWYISRAVEWLERASRGQLLQAGDDFELPQCKADFRTVGFSEDATTFAEWKRSDAAFGTVELASLGAGFPYATRKFIDSHGKEVVAPSWGKIIREDKSPVLGAWIRLPSLPVLPPYAAPMRWGELFSIMESAGCPAASILQSALRPLRDGMAHVLLVGFPIPRHMGEAPSVMHWQPLQLPDLGYGTKPRHGFSASGKGHWLGDLVSGLGTKKGIEWLTGTNWNEKELGTRGRLCPTLRSKRVLLIGAGAIGASVSELLLRGGVNRMIVLDHDFVTAGNLVRHTLALNDVGRGKAARVSTRLNTISPHADVAAIAGHFPRLSQSDRQTIQECDLVLDCSGSDDTLQALAEANHPDHVDFVSIAIGRGAKRLYVFASHGTPFPVKRFINVLSPWLAKDSEEFQDIAFPWEGVGCWHPVFPASADQISLFSAAAVRELNGRYASSATDSALVVFEDNTGSPELPAMSRERISA